MSAKYPISFFVLYLTMFALTACGRVPAQPQQITQPPILQATAQESPIPGLTPLSVPTRSVTVTQQDPLAPETNPVGDIPDSQVFVIYAASPGNYSLDVPEGWARTNNGSDVLFVDKFDGLSVSISQAGSAPTAKSVQTNELQTLTLAGRAFQVGQITEMDLPGGHSVKVTATVNSELDPVTGKQVRLEEDIYIFFHSGAEAMLQLWAPQGADNVDQWKRISESFQWK